MLEHVLNCLLTAQLRMDTLIHVGQNAAAHTEDSELEYKAKFYIAHLLEHFRSDRVSGLFLLCHSLCRDPDLGHVRGPDPDRVLCRSSYLWQTILKSPLAIHFTHTLSVVRNDCVTLALVVDPPPLIAQFELRNDYSARMRTVQG